MCVGCLFNLALDESETLAPRQTEATGPDLLICGKLGEYELIEEIGHGGMGTIYKARTETQSEIVAVKVLTSCMGSGIEARERFEREARAMASLRHPFIMPIHKVCLEGTTPFFSMEFAAGGSLADLLPKYRSRWRQATELVANIARAVHHAHEKGLIHRDLKPGNILFTQDLDPLVSDFGLAKWLDDTGTDLTQSLVMFGTPNYVSPEQASGRNRNLTPATDIYSLGAILFELLAGRPPFVGDSPLRVLQQALVGPAPRLRSVAPTLPADLEAICARCLQTDPADRYPSAAELADDIERWLSGVRVDSRHYSRGRVAKFAENRILLAGAVAALTVVVAGGAYMARQSWKTDRRTAVLPAKAPAITVEVDNFSTNEELDSFSDNMSRVIGVGFDDPATVRVLPVRRLIADSVTSAAVGARTTVNAPASSYVLRESIRRVGTRVRVVSKIFEPGAARRAHARVDWLDLDASSNEFTTFHQTLREWTVARLQDHTPEAAASGSSEMEAALFCKKAVEYFHRINTVDNDYAAALYGSALKLQPNRVSALAGLADAYRMKFSWWGGSEKDLQLARRYAGKALAADPLSAEAHHAMGCCLLAAKRYEEAREELLQEVELKPDSPGGNVSIAICCRELGQPRQALLWCSRAARVDPVHGAFNALLGDLYMVIGEDQKAEKELRRACEIDPEQPDACNMLVVLALWQGQYDKAKELCRDLITRFPTNPYRDQVAAEVALFCGDPAEALVRYSQLDAEGVYADRLEFFGSISPASAVGYLLQKQGKPDEASRSLNAARQTDERLLKQFADNPMLLHDLAAICALSGEREEAFSYLALALRAGWVEQRSTRLDPRFESLRRDQRFTELLAHYAP